MKFRSSHSLEDSPTDYLVPMMDVLFILIIFFVVAFSMSRMETEVNISVPASDNNNPALRDQHQIVINVRADGTMVIMQDVINEAELLRRLGTIANVNKKQAIIIRGDKTVAFDHIYRVLENCRKVGLYHVSFASQNQPSKPPES